MASTSAHLTGTLDAVRRPTRVGARAVHQDVWDNEQILRLVRWPEMPVPGGRDQTGNGLVTLGIRSDPGEKGSDRGIDGFTVTQMRVSLAERGIYRRYRGYRPQRLEVMAELPSTAGGSQSCRPRVPIAASS